MADRRVVHQAGARRRGSLRALGFTIALIASCASAFVGGERAEGQVSCGYEVAAIIQVPPCGLGEPLFVGSGIYRLQATSPAIDGRFTADIQGRADLFDVNQNADVTEVIPDVDLRRRLAGGYGSNGASQPQDCRLVDRGAYEYASSLCPGDFAPPPGDGAVGVADLLAVITAWGNCPAAPHCARPISRPRRAATVRSTCRTCCS